MFLPMLISFAAVAGLNVALRLMGLDLITLSAGAILISGGGFALSVYLNRPVWWRYINAGFPLMVFMFSAFDIGANLYLFLFLLTIFVYWGALIDRVPLYLTNEATVSALSLIADSRGTTEIIDIGSGTGAVVFGLSQRLHNCKITGIESAALTWLVGFLFNKYKGFHNVSWTYGNMWQINLGSYDIVYAFLSPDPMARLWKKVSSEMKAGAMFISNSFPLEDIQPASVVYVGDKRGTVLYCYIPSAHTCIKEH